MKGCEECEFSPVPVDPFPPLIAPQGRSILARGGNPGSTGRMREISPAGATHKPNLLFCNHLCRPSGACIHPMPPHPRVPLRFTLGYVVTPSGLAPSRPSIPHPCPGNVQAMPESGDRRDVSSAWGGRTEARAARQSPLWETNHSEGVEARLQL